MGDFKIYTNEEIDDIPSGGQAKDEQVVIPQMERFDKVGNFIKEVINDKLNTSAQTILKGFDFGAVDYSGAVKAGTITWNIATGAITGGSGVVVYRGGIIGASAGVATFSIDISGNATFAGTLSAPIGTLGALTIAVGGNIKSGKANFADAVNAGWYIGTEGIYVGAAADASKLKYTIADGTFDFIGTISSRSTLTIANAINVGGNLITDIINARLDTSAKSILSDFEFDSADYSGGLKCGTITWNAATGAITGGSGGVFHKGGILFANAGVATITLDAITGNATFAGTLSAAAGTLGSITAGTFTGCTFQTAGAGARTIFDISGVRGYDATPTQRYNLGNDGSGWLGASNVIAWTTAGVVTIGGFTANSTSFSITNGGNTVILSSGVNALIAGATGSPTFTLTQAGVVSMTSAIIGNWTVNTTSIFTGTEDHSGYTANAGDITLYSDGADASIHAKNWYIDTAGVLNCTAAVISGAITTTAGSVLDGGYLSANTVASASANLALRGWTFSGTFSASDADTVAWGAGTFTASDGTAYAIGAGNTGNMVALTYIYLDIAISVIALQTTTTASTAIGNGKVLIAVAQNQTSRATFQIFGGSGGTNLLVDNLVANSASTNEFVSNTAQLANLVVTNAKINDLAVSKLTAGTITSKTIVLAVSDTVGDVYISGGTVDTGAWTATNGFILGIDDSDSNKEKFFIGNATQSLDWNVTTLNTLTVKGAITADTGYLGGTSGWVISANYIKDVAGLTGLSSIVTAGDDIRIWAGHATPASAPFRVTEAGVVTATDIIITAKAGSNIWPTMTMVGYFAGMNNTGYYTSVVALDYSESATGDIALLGYTTTNGIYNLARWQQLSSTASPALTMYNSNTSGATTVGTPLTTGGAIKIGSYFYVSYDVGGVNAMTRWAEDLSGSSAITFSGGTYYGSLSYDNANSYLLVLTNTTQIRRYTISGTTITYNSLITLSSACDSMSPAFFYDGTNIYAYSGTSLKKYDSTGTYISSLTVGVTGSLVKGLIKLQGILYLAIEAPEKLDNNGYIKQQYIIQLVPLNNF